MMNFWQEVIFPACFVNFRGENLQSSVIRDTESFALRFGDKSKSDEKTVEIFGEFKSKLAEKKYKGVDPKSYFELVQDYD